MGQERLGKKKKLLLEKSSFEMKGYIDNDECKHGTTIEGVPVISFNEFYSHHSEDFLIISVGEKFIEQIINQVHSVGLQNGGDYVIEERDLLALAEITYNNRLYIPLVQISLTERCTRKCKKCAHGCNMVSSDCVDLSIDEVKRTCDEFFSW